MQLSKPTIQDNTHSTARYFGSLAFYNEVVDYMTSSSFADTIKKYFGADPYGYVIKGAVYPFDIQLHDTANSAASTSVVFGDIKHNTSTSHYIMGSGYNYELDLGSEAIAEKYSGALRYLNYEPYCKMSIYLPYIGMRTLIPSQVVGKTISIKYIVDFTDASCTSYIFLTENGNTVLLDIARGKIGVELPISQTNAAEVQRNQLLSMLTAVGAVVGTAASGGSIAPVAMGTVASTLSSASQPIRGAVQGAGVGGIANFYAPQSVYITREYDVTDEPSSYNEMFGRPSNKTVANLSVLAGTGYAEVAEIHLEGLDFASEDDLAEIETMLKEGVIL